MNQLLIPCPHEFQQSGAGAPVIRVTRPKPTVCRRCSDESYARWLHERREAERVAEDAAHELHELAGGAR